MPSTVPLTTRPCARGPAKPRLRKYSMSDTRKHTTRFRIRVLTVPFDQHSRLPAPRRRTRPFRTPSPRLHDATMPWTNRDGAHDLVRGLHPHGAQAAA